MRKLLLATSSAALVLGLCGGAPAEPRDTNPSASNTLVPPAVATPSGLLFSQDSGDAKPLASTPKPSSPVEPFAPAAQMPTDQATPGEVQATPGQVAPAEQTAKPSQSDEMKPAIAAEDAALTERLRDLTENKLAQFVPKEQDRAGVLAFYRGRNFAPLWVANGKPNPRARQAMDFLRGIDADGLDPADYPTPRFGDADPAKLAADELTLTNSIVTFARHASIGRTAFSRVSGSVWFDRKPPNPSDVLGQVAESSDPAATLDGFNPQAPGYKALKAELAALRSGKDAGAEPRDAAKDARAAKKKGKSAKKHGADEPEHRTASKAAKIETILANMERWRWMPHDLAASYVMVNIPDYTLKVVQNGKTVWQTKIVVGKPGSHATPLLSQSMKYITVNPTWNVPPSIIKNEYLPVLARDPDALARVGLKIAHNPDGSIRIYQPPGEKNALGRIRFNFPNRFLVYQHDTPDKKLFNLSARAYSHGCMRVQNPDQYAEVLLKISQPQDNYTAAKIRSMYGSSERTINFKNPIPVYITYQTAFVDDAGKPQFRSDIYGLDKDTLAVLHGDRRIADVPMARNYDSGSKPVMAARTAHGREARDPRDPREMSAPATTGWNSSPDYLPNWRSAFQPADRSRVW